MLIRLLCQNDDIEKSASERFAIYRRCKLEEIRLPLVSGSVDDVPLEEVCPSLAQMMKAWLTDARCSSQSTEDAMELDESNEATQHIATAKDYGIAVDFEDELSDDEREVGRLELTPPRSSLNGSLRQNGSNDMEAELQANVQSLIDEIQKMTPNLKAIDRYAYSMGPAQR